MAGVDALLFHRQSVLPLKASHQTTIMGKYHVYMAQLGGGKLYASGLAGGNVLQLETLAPL